MLAKRCRVALLLQVWHINERLKSTQEFLQIAITGDSTGRIQIWRQKNDFQFFATEVHWHSLSVSCFAFSPEGVYFFSGGGEGAVLKWELVSGRRVALVPRLGSTVTSISASDASVIVSTDTNLLKVFTPNLDDDQMITGLTKEIQDSGRAF